MLLDKPGTPCHRDSVSSLGAPGTHTPRGHNARFGDLPTAAFTCLFSTSTSVRTSDSVFSKAEWQVRFAGSGLCFLHRVMCDVCNTHTAHQNPALRRACVGRSLGVSLVSRLRRPPLRMSASPPRCRKYSARQTWVLPPKEIACCCLHTHAAALETTSWREDEMTGSRGAPSASATSSGGHSHTHPSPPFHTLSSNREAFAANEIAVRRRRQWRSLCKYSRGQQR